MRAVVSVFAVAMALLAAAAPAVGAAPDALERAVVESASSDPEVRAEGIRKLGELSGPVALETLTALVVAEPPDPELRERGWRDALVALSQVAPAHPFPAALQDRLRSLQAMEPTIRVQLPLKQARLPKYDFKDAARRALGAHLYAEARRALEAETRALDRAGRVAALSAVAWRPEDASHDGTRRKAARELLVDLGPASVAAAAAAFPGLSETQERYMFKFLGAVAASGRPQDALPGFLALTHSRHRQIWASAFEQISRQRTPAASAVIRERIRGIDTSDAERFRYGLFAIGAAGQPDAVPFLVEWLDHPKARIGATAATALRLLGDDGRRALLTAFASHEPLTMRAVRHAFEPNYYVTGFLRFSKTDPGIEFLHPFPSDDSTREHHRHFERLRALQELALQPDPTMTFALALLAERTYAEDESAKRDEITLQIARAVDALVRDGHAAALPPELVDFHRRIAASPATRSSGDVPHREWAEIALLDMEVDEAERRIRSELGERPTGAAFSRLAATAWGGADRPDVRGVAARAELARHGAEALAASRPWLRKATARNRMELVDFLRRQYGAEPETVALDLLALADVGDAGAAEAAHAVLRELRPPGLTEPLVLTLERRSDPARTRRGLETLAVLADPAALPFAESRLTSPDEASAVAAVRVLVSLGARGEERLAKALPHLQRGAEREAGIALVAAKTPEAREAVLQLVATNGDAALQQILLPKLVAATDAGPAPH